MPTTFPGALATHIQQDTATLAYFFKLTYTHPINGVTSRGFTTAPLDATIAGVTGYAHLGVVPSSLTFQVGLVSDRFEISGFFASDGITESDIHAGLYSAARVEVYSYNWASPSDGAAWLTTATVADITIDGRQWTFECADLLRQLQQNLNEVTGPACRNQLFDTRCKVRDNPPVWTASTAYTISSTYEAHVGSWVKPSTQNRRWFRAAMNATSGGTEPTWNTTIGGTTVDNGNNLWITRQALVLTGTVTSKLSDQIFADSGITEANDFWKYGKIVWLTGANTGYQKEIKSQTGTQIELQSAMVNAVTVGDVFTIFTGCDKIDTTCRDKFQNLLNNRSEHLKPSNKILSKTGKR